MSEFWNNNKDTFKKAGIATLKGGTKATVFVSKQGYNAVKSAREKEVTKQKGTVAKEGEEEEESQTVRPEMTLQGSKSFGPPPARNVTPGGTSQPRAQPLQHGQAVQQTFQQPQTAQYQPVQQTAQYQPVQQTAQYQPVQQTAQYQPVQQTAQYQPVQQTAQYQPAQQQPVWQQPQAFQQPQQHSTFYQQQQPPQPAQHFQQQQQQLPSLASQVTPQQPDNLLAQFRGGSSNLILSAQPQQLQQSQGSPEAAERPQVKPVNLLAQFRTGSSLSTIPQVQKTNSTYDRAAIPAPGVGQPVQQQQQQQQQQRQAFHLAQQPPQVQPAQPAQQIPVQYGQTQAGASQAPDLAAVNTSTVGYGSQPQTQAQLGAPTPASVPAPAIDIKSLPKPPVHRDRGKTSTPVSQSTTGVGKRPSSTLLSPAPAISVVSSTVNKIASPMPTLPARGAVPAPPVSRGGSASTVVSPPPAPPARDRSLSAAPVTPARVTSSATAPQTVDLKLFPPPPKPHGAKATPPPRPVSRGTPEAPSPVAGSPTSGAPLSRTAKPEPPAREAVKGSLSPNSTAGNIKQFAPPPRPHGSKVFEAGRAKQGQLQAQSDSQRPSVANATYNSQQLSKVELVKPTPIEPTAAPPTNTHLPPPKSPASSYGRSGANASLNKVNTHSAQNASQEEAKPFHFARKRTIPLPDKIIEDKSLNEIIKKESDESFLTLEINEKFKINEDNISNPASPALAEKPASVTKPKPPAPKPRLKMPAPESKQKAPEPKPKPPAPKPKAKPPAPKPKLQPEASAGEDTHSTAPESEKTSSPAAKPKPQPPASRKTAVEVQPIDASSFDFRKNLRSVRSTSSSISNLDHEATKKSVAPPPPSVKPKPKPKPKPPFGTKPKALGEKPASTYERAAVPLPTTAPSRSDSEMKRLVEPEWQPHELDLELDTGWFAYTRDFKVPKCFDNLTYTTSLAVSSNHATRFLSARFFDLSISKVKIEWDPSVASPSNSGFSKDEINALLRTVKVERVDISPPIIPSKEILIENSNRFGDYVANWVETKLGQKVGDGECWTLAQQALKKGCGSHAYVSDAFNHGAKYLTLKAESGVIAQSEQLDDVRRGDIIQYKSCVFKNSSTTKTVGNPDHTSIVLAVKNSSSGVAAKAVLEIAQQNVNGIKNVMVDEIDLSDLYQGELRFFRPVNAEWAGELNNN